MTDYFNLYLVAFVYYRVGSCGELLCDSTNKYFFRIPDTEDVVNAVNEFYNPHADIKLQKYIKSYQHIKRLLADAKRGE